MSRRTRLVFSPDPLAAALLGATIELTGFAPQFASERESARAAVKRVRPELVLIDCAHEEACSDQFIGPAIMMKAMVLLFRSAAAPVDVSALVERMALRVIAMPDGYEQFIEILRALPGR